MKQRQYVIPVTFFVTQQMFNSLKMLSDNDNISLSELLRIILENHLQNRIGIKQKNEPEQ